MAASSPFFLRILLLPPLVLIAAMLLVAPPRLHPAIRSAVSAEAAPTAATESGPVEASPELHALQSILGEYREPDVREAEVEPEVFPRALASLNVYIGPGENYAIVGQVPRGGRLDIVGRDPTGNWLAVHFTPDSKLNGWIPLAKVSGLTDAKSLPVATVTLLPAR